MLRKVFLFRYILNFIPKDIDTVCLVGLLHCNKRKWVQLLGIQINGVADFGFFIHPKQNLWRGMKKKNTHNPSVRVATVLLKPQCPDVQS